MNFLNIFRIYNLNRIKEERTLFIITALSICLNICISLSIPQVEMYSRQYMDRNIEEINGGDLQVKVSSLENNEFNNKIDELKKEGIEVKTCYSGNASYTIASNKVVGGIILDDSDIDENEIILSSVIASNMNLHIGDKISVNIGNTCDREFVIKEIEMVSKAVDRDSEILGYGKIKGTNVDYSNLNKCIFLKGEEGSVLKEELESLAPNYTYTTLEEKRNSVKNEMAIESVALGVLSVVTYIICTLSISTAVIMLLIKRKRDIAILRMASVRLKDIKIATILEVMLWVVPSIIVGAIISFPISKVILSYKGIIEEFNTFKSLVIIGKGIMFNLIILIILTLLFVKIIGGISPLTILKRDRNPIKRKSNISIIESVFLVPIIIVIYSFAIKDMGSLISLIGITVLSMLFLGLVVIVLRLASKIPWRNVHVLYIFKSIRENLLSFTLVILSVTMTLWFILLGFYLNDTIKDNINESIKDSLPYNYDIKTTDKELLEQVLNNDKNINGYDKVYDISGEIINSSMKKSYKNISLCEISEEDYGARFKIVEGDNLFESGEEGVIISDHMFNKNAFKIGDILEIKTETGNVQIKIKGVYKSSGINSNAIYKENKELGKNVSYYINSNSDEFLKQITNAKIFNMKDIGQRFAASLLKFLNVFKFLTAVSVISLVLFNVNMMNMNNSFVKKDEAIISTISVNNMFLEKVRIIKISIIVIISSILSIGLFSLLVKLAFKIVFDYSCNVNLSIVFIVILISVLVTGLSFKLCKRSGENLELLKEW